MIGSLDGGSQDGGSLRESLVSTHNGVFFSAEVLSGAPRGYLSGGSLSEAFGGSLGGGSDSEALSGYLSVAEDLTAVLVRWG